jgi:phosphoglycerol transferase
MSGRRSDIWASAVARRAPTELVAAVSDAGFSGILIDRDGYGDLGAALEADLRAILPAEATSGDGRLTFFSLDDYDRSHHVGESPESRARRRHDALGPFSIFWKGFYRSERESTRTFRWSRGASELWIENESPTPRRVSLTMTLFAAQAPAHLRLRGDLLSSDLELPAGGVRFAPTVDLPPGRHVVHFDCDGRPADAPADPRNLVWRVDNFDLAEAPSTR